VYLAEHEQDAQGGYQRPRDPVVVVGCKRVIGIPFGWAAKSDRLFSAGKGVLSVAMSPA
jgi:hypothetical protein